MACLLDTNILVRLANQADVLHTVAIRSVVELRRRGELLHITPQNLIEFRNVATRAVAVNGLGMTVQDAQSKSLLFETGFLLVPEGPSIFLAWKTLVESLGVVGKQVHDARLVAICHANSISHLLTFNTGHFARFASATPGLVILDPRTL